MVYSTDFSEIHWHPKLRRGLVLGRSVSVGRPALNGGENVMDGCRTSRRALLVFRWSSLMALTLNGSFATACDLRIDHVTIVSADRPHSTRDATVTIRGDRIATISHHPPSASTRKEGWRSKSAIAACARVVYLGIGPGQEQAFPDIAQEAREQVPRSHLYLDR
jgi:hypothetical protein